MFRQMFQQQPTTRSLRPALAVVIASTTALGLTACGGGEEPAAETPAVQDEASASAESTAEAAEETGDPAAAEGGQPAWAHPVSTEGDVVSTIELDGGITVEVHQVGTAKATKTGNFVDPENNEPIIAVGDEVVFVNYVVTNNGDPVDLGSSLVSVEVRYDDWPYLQGMDGITDSALSEEMGVMTNAVAEPQDPPVYTLGTGESYAQGENFLYQAGSPFTAEVTVTPVDAEGQLLFDEQIEGSGTGTIK